MSHSIIQIQISPLIAGVWWAHWCGCSVAAVTSTKWMLHTGGGWGQILWYDCKSDLGV